MMIQRLDTTGEIEFNQSGDQLFAGTAAFSDFGNTMKPGSTYSGVLLAGLDFSGNNITWDADATSTLTSALPLMLSDDLLNIAVPGPSRRTRQQYVGPRNGFTVSEFKLLVDNPHNWSASDIDLLDSTDFAIAVPEPGMPVFLTCCGAAGWLRRRRSRCHDRPVGSRHGPR